MIKIISRNILFYIISVALLFVMVVIGPMDFFTHGYFCNEINISEAAGDLDIPIDLSQGDYEMYFSPVKRHFTGIEILLRNQPSENSGTLVMTILGDNEKLFEIIEVDLSKVKDNTWYKTYVSAKLKAGQSYLLKFSIRDCSNVPMLVTIDRDYLREETLEGNVALAYAYKESTFTFQTKILIFLFIISLWLCVAPKFLHKVDNKFLRTASLFLCMTGVLAWNYMYNSMDNFNSNFEDFQADSETLVRSTIIAEKNNIWFTKADDMGFGLGRYHDSLGVYSSYILMPRTDDNWSKGYSKTEAAFLINSNTYTKDVLKDLSFVKFANGNILGVTEAVDDGTNIVIHVESDRLLNSEKYGEVQDIKFISSQMTEYKPAALTAYKSQYGLQGKVLRHLAKYMPDDIEIATLNLLCALSTAAVFSIITLLLAAKYDYLLAGISFLTFWLSPWVVCFARNLYWVEFTWFIPMTVGLFCAWKVDNKKCRIFSYIAAFLAIVVKCLCGYEYISSIMMGLISFMLIDFIVSAVRRDKEKAKLLCRAIFIIGFIALLGFMTAICIHAPLRAEGSLMQGIKNIFFQDVIRRTGGGDLNDFEAVYWASFNASVWEVFCKYFKFSSEIIVGMKGNLFPLLCCTPLVIFAYEYHKKRLNIERVAMYMVFFLTSISWFCLAKSHSYIHGHMNYVLWYFGFIQTCFYIIMNKIIETYKNFQGDIKQ